MVCGVCGCVYGCVCVVCDVLGAMYMCVWYGVVCIYVVVCVCMCNVCNVCVCA